MSPEPQGGDIEDEDERVDLDQVFSAVIQEAREKRRTRWSRRGRRRQVSVKGDCKDNCQCHEFPTTSGSGDKAMTLVEVTVDGKKSWKDMCFSILLGGFFTTPVPDYPSVVTV